MSYQVWETQEGLELIEEYTDIMLVDSSKNITGWVWRDQATHMDSFNTKDGIHIIQGAVSAAFRRKGIYIRPHCNGFDVCRVYLYRHGAGDLVLTWDNAWRCQMSPYDQPLTSDIDEAHFKALKAAKALKGDK